MSAPMGAIPGACGAIRVAPSASWPAASAGSYGLAFYFRPGGADVGCARAGEFTNRTKVRELNLVWFIG
jgi:hypothetical protein